MADLGCLKEALQLEERLFKQERRAPPAAASHSSVPPVRLVRDGGTGETSLVLVGSPDTSAIRRSTCEPVTSLTVLGGQAADGFLASLNFK